jgi:hypothetical protein
MSTMRRSARNPGRTKRSTGCGRPWRRPAGHGPRIAEPRNLTRDERVQVDMRARKRHIVPSACDAVMVGAVVLAVAACGVTGPAADNGARRPESPQPLRPGTAVTMTLSRAPRPGKLTSAPAAPSRHRRITAGHSGQVTVTTADDGATVTVVPGQVITVVLGGQGMLRWNRPQLAGSAPGVLRQLSASGGYPSKAPARASYRAVRAGPAEIFSGSNARCLHTHPPCEIAQRLWRVTVVVR